MKKAINTWPFVIIISLTLGLAPFVPEPHIWGKLRWIAGGAKGMQPIDWFDTLLHGLPWLLLIRLIILKTVARIKN
ncbi:MAG TPA: hypothetical protein DDY13_13045 [Cytophagales bacterium]|jgi:cell division protein FtsW (lipid II flippase)|nr:hypothetical protein [Cytophagales bacterium]